MAVVNLAGAINVPFIQTIIGVGTTWQEVRLPRWTCRVTIVGSAAGRVTVTGAESPTDGGAVGTHYVAIPEESGVVFVIRGPDSKPVIPGLTYASSIFIAAASGTATFSVTLEAGRQ